MHRLPTLAAITVASLLGACGGNDATPDPGAVQGDDGAAHIHGLGVNPADRALYVATHTGLFRAAAGEARPRRVGDRRQDTMGFTVAGPDLFLGSGHPDVRDELPSHLGLIRSEDRGRTWSPVSLLGDADFHVLRSRGRTLYGFDVTHGRLLASGDAGATWQQRRAPAPLVDLAIDPQDPRHLVASGPDGLFESPDGGRAWRARRGAPAGLLAWTDALVLIDGDGRVHRSTDAGRTFTEAGAIGGRPAALAAHGRELYAATHDNVIEVSRDGGRTWTVRARA
ncbi:MAG TPA: hypothetical protein VD931_21460 [Baekduia sp.]|nr:hypothetical protein [Baekduia sp.]